MGTHPSSPNFWIVFFILKYLVFYPIFRTFHFLNKMQLISHKCHPVTWQFLLTFYLKQIKFSMKNCEYHTHTIHFNDISPFIYKKNFSFSNHFEWWMKKKFWCKKTDIKIILIKNESWSNLFVAFLNVIVVFTPKFNKLKKNNASKHKKKMLVNGWRDTYTFFERWNNELLSLFCIIKRKYHKISLNKKK